MDARMMEFRESSSHLSDGRLAAFLDGRLSSTERDQALAHFASCASCRREMSAARRLLAGSVRRRPWNSPFVATLAAALILAAGPIFVLRERRDDPARAGGNAVPVAERAAQPDLMSVVPIVSPVDQATVEDSIIVFRWRSAGSDATYRLTLQDATGTVVWDVSVADTTAALPRRIMLGAQQRYYWSVDALLSDGRSARAGVHVFTTR
jgi:hypothetical protein